MIIRNSFGASPKLSKSHRKLRSLEKPINATNPIPIPLGVGWGNTDTASRKSSCGNCKSWQRLEGDFVVCVGDFSLRPSNVIPNYEVTHKLQVPITGLQILTMEIVFLPLENEGGGSPLSTERRRLRSHPENETFWSKLSTWPSFDLVSNQNGKYVWVFNTLTQLKMKSLDWEFDNWLKSIHGRTCCFARKPPPWKIWKQRWRRSIFVTFLWSDTVDGINPKQPPGM